MTAMQTGLHACVALVGCMACQLQTGTGALVHSPITLPCLQSPRGKEVSAEDYYAAEPDVLKGASADLVKLWNE